MSSSLQPSEKPLRTPSCVSGFLLSWVKDTRKDQNKEVVTQRAAEIGKIGAQFGEKQFGIYVYGPR